MQADNDKQSNAAAERNKSATESGEPGAPFSVADGISVPSNSNIIGGGTPGEATDMATASGPSDSGGG